MKSRNPPRSLSGLIVRRNGIRAALDALNGWDPTGGCLYYYNPKKTSNKWMLSHDVVLSIGEHAFF